MTRYLRILPRDRLSKCLEDRISLFNLIDTTKSVRQRNNLRNFFLNPVSDPDVIEKRHNIIQDCKTETCRDAFKSVFPISKFFVVAKYFLKNPQHHEMLERISSKFSMPKRALSKHRLLLPYRKKLLKFF